MANSTSNGRSGSTGGTGSADGTGGDAGDSRRSGDRAIRRGRGSAAALTVHGSTMIAPASAEADHSVGHAPASAGITRPAAGMLDGQSSAAASHSAPSDAPKTRRRGPQVRKVSAASASKYTAATREAFLDAYLATANLKQAAAAAGVDPSTIYKWLKRYPSFAAARDRTLAEAYADLEMHMIHMARHGAVAVTSTSKNGETVVRVHQVDIPAHAIAVLDRQHGPHNRLRKEAQERRATGEDIGFAEVEAMIDRLQNHLDEGGTATAEAGATDGASGDGCEGEGA